MTVTQDQQSLPQVLYPDDAAIDLAAGQIMRGGLVVFPTETVYGLGANALDGRAVARIFAAKGRPQFNPIIVHGHDIDMLRPHVVMDARAEKLATRFWPGPLTIILPRTKLCGASELCSAGLPTLAVRVPAHKVARDLISRAGVPIAAPSANRSGGISPTTPQHVIESLGADAEMVLAAGSCTVGLESTVLDLSDDVPVILRPGAITDADVTNVLGQKIGYDFGAHAAPKSPGQLLRHYAPSIPLRLNAIDVGHGEALLAFGSVRFMGIKGGGAARDLNPDHLRNLSEQGDLHEAAANLFRMLRDLDRPDVAGIAVMNIPDTGLGIAINDRLRRAAQAGAVS